MAKDKFTIKYGSDNKDFVKGSKQVQKEFQKSAKSAKKFGSIASGAVSSFVGNLAAAGVSAGFGAISRGFGSIISLAKDFTQAASVQEDSIKSLNNSLVRAGTFSEEMSASYQKLASSIQENSKFGDELILSQAALARNFTKTDEQAKKLIKSAVELAAATGMSLDAAVEQLGKTMSGTTGRLAQMIPELKGLTQEALKSGAAFDIIMDKFGGAAAAQIETFSGAMTQSQNIIGDFQEELGFVITQSPEVIAVIKGIGDIFLLFGEQVKENKSGLQSFVSEGVSLFIDGIGQAGEAIEFFLDLSTGFDTFTNFITDFTLGATEQLLGFAKGTAEIAAEVGEFLGISTSGIDSFNKSIDRMTTNIENAREVGRQNTAEAIASNELQKQSLRDFTNQAQELLRKRIADQKEAGAAELETMASINEEKTAMHDTEKEEDLIRREDELTFMQLSADENLEFLRGSLGAEEAERSIARAKELANQGKHKKANDVLRKAKTKAEKNDIFAITKFRDLSDKQRLASLQGTLGTISSLTSSSNRKEFEVGKAAAVVNATIQGFLGAQRALGSAPPPVNFILAAAVGAVALRNVMSIKNQKMTGAFKGALVGEGSSTRDSVPMLLSRGEIIAPKRSFDEVVEGTARQRGFVKGKEQDVMSQMLMVLMEIKEALSPEAGSQVVEIRLASEFIEFIEEELRGRRSVGITSGGSVI